jgi:DNA-binding MarR family transcriptional regulator
MTRQSKIEKIRQRRAIAGALTLYTARQKGISTLGEAEILLLFASLIASGNEVTSCTVVAHTQIPKSNVTRYLDKFRRKGWASETISETDRRRRVLRITDLGWSEIEDIVALLP